ALYDPCRVGNEIIIASLNVMGEVRYPVKMAIIVTYLFTVPLCFLFGSYLKWGLPMIWLVFIIDEGFRLYAFIKRWKDAAWVAH
ncbi:MATE family efflux transporter, partial [Staphylococcus aureus]|nr:MATE family efflux transporter [Staphylococcus aureus]